MEVTNVNQLTMHNSRDDLNWIASKPVGISTKCQVSQLLDALWGKISVTQTIDNLVFILHMQIERPEYLVAP